MSKGVYKRKPGFADKIRVIKKALYANGFKNWNAGKKWSEESKRKMRLHSFRKGKGGPVFSEDGLKRLRESKLGSKNPAWKGGVDPNFYNAKKRAIKRNAKGKHTYKDWCELKEKYNNMCLCCKRFEPEIKLTEDHIVPLSKGGTNYIANIQPLCLSCNCRKQAKTINFILTLEISE